MIKNITPKTIAVVTIIIAIAGLAVQVMILLASHFIFESPVLLEAFAYLTCFSSIQLSVFDIEPPEISPF
ncbi:MAG: hypothetical protein ACRC3B_22530, partial [Bacteroidia bacterium]